MRGKDAGAVALEFLLLFPMIISLVYSAGVYGVLFSQQVRMQIAVDRATAAVMALDRSGSTMPAGCASGSFDAAVAAECLAEAAIGAMVPPFMGSVDATQACSLDSGQVVCGLAISTGGASCVDGFSGAVGSGSGPRQLGFFDGFPPLPNCLTASARVAF